MTKMQYHMSISAASEALERTRRTIKRALRDVEPSSYERGQPRWKLAVIVEALRANTAPKSPKHHNGGGRWGGSASVEEDLENDRLTLALFNEFNDGFAKLRRVKDLEKRRKMVVAMAKVADACVRLYIEHCEEDGGFSDPGGRADCQYQQMIDLLGEACEWTHNEIWQKI
jgi:hypothetical protein